MDKNTKLGLAVAGVLATGAGLYFGRKYITLPSIKKHVEDITEATENITSDTIDATKKVVDEVTDSLD